MTKIEPTIFSSPYGAKVAFPLSEILTAVFDDPDWIEDATETLQKMESDDPAVSHRATMNASLLFSEIMAACGIEVD